MNWIIDILLACLLGLLLGSAVFTHFLVFMKMEAEEKSEKTILQEAQNGDN